jgi:hypothetical protein
MNVASRNSLQKYLDAEQTYGRIWIRENGGITKHARKNEDAAAIDHEAVAEPSHSLSLDSSSKAATFGKRPRPYGYIRPGSKNGQRRSGTGLTMVHGHPAATVTPAAESRQGLQ